MCTACHAPMTDTAATEAFADQLLDMLNQGALSLMVSIGHRTGLFDAMAELPPSTVDEIAAQAGLAPRYVQEWLGAMVAGGIVDYHAAARRYLLPREHAALLGERIERAGELWFDFRGPMCG